MQPSSGAYHDDRAPSLVGGRYELGPKLGEGAFSVTYRAIDRVLGRPVAVKIARTQYASDRDFVVRFEREARLAASVSHPNIVDVYDYGPHQDTYFIAMQYVPGSDLRRVLDDRGRLTTDEAIRIARQVLAGLTAIHAVGIIHRDIKPHNVLIGSDGMARVTDFGVAQASIEEGLTTQGTTVGTASYMAPEQARGGALSVRTDLYAVGVMLFECLTGRLPFEAANPMAVMLAHLQRPAPKPSEVAPDAPIPAALEEVVMRALAKDPAGRYADAAQMATALGTARAHDSRLDDDATRRLPAAVVRAETVTVPPGPVAKPGPRPVPVAPARTGIPWNRIGAVLFVLTAILAGGLALAATLSDRWGGDGSENQPAVVDLASPSPSATATPTAPSATATALAIQGAVATVTALPAEPQTQTPTEQVASTATATASPTQTAAATVIPTQTATPTLEATATLTPLPTATPSQVPLPTTTSTPLPEPTATSMPTDTPVPVEVDTGNAGSAPTIASSVGQRAASTNGEQDSNVITFGVADWSGACGGVDTASFGRAAVAIRGSTSSCPRATLSFSLNQTPAGMATLTLNGFNGEEIPLLAGIEINGSRSTGSNQFFELWDGEAASVAVTWGTAQISIPPGYLRQGENTISLISETEGSTDSGPPYALLGTASLQL